MTKFKIAYALLIIVMAVFFIFSGIYFSFVAVVLILSLPIFLYGCTILTSIKISVLFGKCSYAIEKLENGEIELEINNPSFFHINSAKLYLEIQNIFSDKKTKEVLIFPINSRRKTIVKTSFQSVYCGEVDVNVKKLKLYDFLSLTHHSKRINKTLKVSVLPKVHELYDLDEPALIMDMESFSYSTQELGDDKSQVFDYHEYSEGDKINDIHWKLSTKLDKFMVKEGSLPNSATVLLALELNKEKKASLAVTDSALDALASASSKFIENNIPHSIEWYAPNNQCNENMKLTEKQDFFVALEQIYQTKSHIGCPLLDEISSKISSSFKPTQIFYITCQLDESMTAALEKLNEETELIVCHIHEKDEKVSENVLKELLLHDIALIEFGVL